MRPPQTGVPSGILPDGTRLMPSDGAVSCEAQLGKYELVVASLYGV